MRAPKHYIREWRKHRGLTMEQLAMRANMSTAGLSRLERGEQRYNQALLEKLAVALGCGVSDLISSNPIAPDDIQTLVGRMSPGARTVGRALLEAVVANDTAPSPLHVPEAEAQIVGCMIHDDWAAKRMARSTLSGEMFEDNLLGGIYEIICQLAEERNFTLGDPIRLISHIETCDDPELKRMFADAGGLTFLTLLLTDLPPADHIAHLAGEIAAADVRRSIAGQRRSFIEGDKP